jgi:NAD(P)-dependent dehydrogenase (short-subunit alcohol dehydrogenase family)
VIAVVTGAGRGIGRAVAVELARRGADVALLARTRAELDETAAAVAVAGRRALVVPCDVASAAEVAAAADRVAGELGAPSIVVANAGVVRRASVAEMSEAEWDVVVDVNLKGVFLTARAFLAGMLAAKRGRFIAVGSISSTLGTPRQSAYCAAKWGVVGFVKSLAEEVRGTGVQAMCVLPGSVDTAMLRGSGFEPQMSAADVANLVAYAALDAPDAMNGSAVEMFGP